MPPLVAYLLLLFQSSVGFYSEGVALSVFEVLLLGHSVKVWRATSIIDDVEPAG
jgi:hypothetical protein